MVILASNLKQNMDTAFMRRFQSMIHFPRPTKAERKRIWEVTVPLDLPLDNQVNFENLVNYYEITASQISNIVQSCFINAVAQHETIITKENLIKNMRLEFSKEDLLFENVL